MAASAAARLHQLARRLDGLDRVIVDAAGTVYVDELETQLTRDTGDGALSGIARGRYRLTVKVTPLSSPAGVRIRPAPKQTGMWTILDSGRSGYQVAAKPRRKRRAAGGRRLKATASRARAMNVAGAWRTGPWSVGGTAGKRTWSNARDRARPAAIDAARDALREVIGGR